MALATGAVVLFQGDSITDAGRNRQAQDKTNDIHAMGTGYAHFAGAALAADMPERNLQLFNRGISGNRIVDLYARWREDCINLQPALVSILIGVNDTWHGFTRNTGVTVEKFARVYRQLLTETVEALPQAKLVICEPFTLPCGVIQPAWIDDMAARRAVVKALAGDFGAVFVPFQEMFDAAQREAPAAYWAADGVHPSPAGHMRMARLWRECVKGHV